MNEYALKLNFGTNMGKTVSITVPRAHKDIEDSAVRAAMDAIIQSGVVDTGAGRLISKESAELVTTMRDDLKVK